MKKFLLFVAAFVVSFSSAKASPDHSTINKGLSVANTRSLSVSICPPATTICQGQGVILQAIPSGGSSPYDYIWSPAYAINSTVTSNPTVAPTGTTVYTVTVTDGLGASASNSVTITVVSVPTPTLTGPDSVCSGTQGNVYTTQAGMTNYVWSVLAGGVITAGATATDNTVTVTWITAGAQTVSVNYTNSNGCSANSATIYNVSINALPTADFNMVADSVVLHHYFVVNNATGAQPLSYYWSWGDGTHDSIAYPTHTYSTAGFYKICLSVTDSNGCSNTYCDSSYLQKDPNTIISVDVVSQITTGINETESADQIKVYPNPTTDNITIEASQKSIIEISNMQGELLKTLAAEGNKTNIDVSAFAKGIYILKIQNADGIVFKKFVKE